MFLVSEYFEGKKKYFENRRVLMNNSFDIWCYWKILNDSKMSYEYIMKYVKLNNQ